jgi:hypothetical protein
VRRISSRLATPVNHSSFPTARSLTRSEDAAAEVRDSSSGQPMSWPPTAEDLEAVEVLLLDTPAPARATRPPRTPTSHPVHLPSVSDTHHVRTGGLPGMLPDVLDLDEEDGDNFVAEADTDRRRVPGRGAGRGRLTPARALGVAAAAAMAVVAVGLVAATVDWPAAWTRLALPASTVEAPNVGGDVARANATPSPASRDAGTPVPLPDQPPFPASTTEADTPQTLSTALATPTATSATPAGTLRGEAIAPDVPTRLAAAGPSTSDTSSLRPLPLSEVAGTGAPVAGGVESASAEVALAAQPPAPPQPRPMPDPVAATLPAAPTALSSAPAALLPPDRPLAAAPPPPIARPASPPVSDDVRIQGVLRRYEAAYAQLDARAAQAVWPSVDVRALSRAFDGLESQSVRLGNCQFDVGDSVAHAECLGSTSYVPRVGSRTPRTELRSWTFRLRKVGEQWEIMAAQIR